MPHITVQLMPGRPASKKQELSDRIVEIVKQTLASEDASISVRFEEVDRQDWMDRIYVPEIEGKWDSLTKRPGYGPRS